MRVRVLFENDGQGRAREREKERARGRERERRGRAEGDSKAPPQALRLQTERICVRECVRGPAIIDPLGKI